MGSPLTATLRGAYANDWVILPQDRDPSLDCLAREA